MISKVKNNMIIAKGREVPTIELLYICDEEFKKAVKELRAKFSIVSFEDDLEEYVPVEKIIEFDNKLINNRRLFDTYVDAISQLAQKYDLDGIDEELETFVESGETSISYGRKSLKKHRVLTKPEIAPRIANGFEDPSILGVQVVFNVNKYVTVSDLKSWIDRYAERIVTESNDYLGNYKQGITSLTKAERIVRVIQLKDRNPKLKWKEIADIITKDNPDDPDSIKAIINEKSVMMMYKRYKRRFLKK